MGISAKDREVAGGNVIVAGRLQIRWPTLDDDPRYALAEPVPNVIEPRLAALIFNAIVQKCRNREVFVAAVLQNRRSYGQQMSHVRRAGSFTDLSSVNVSCVEESAIKAVGQHSCLGQWLASLFLLD
jgi:hypothetical protein